MEGIDRLALLKTPKINTKTALNFVEHIEPTAGIGMHSIQKTLLDEDTSSSSPPVQTQGEDEQQQKENTARTWYTLEGVTIPLEQISILSPSVGKSLHLEKRVIPVQVPGAGEVLVKVAWRGVCGSDVLFSTGPQEGYRGKDHVAGHEGLGHIVQSQDPSLLGFPVAMQYLASYCRSCAYCLQDLPESCEQQTNFPKHYQGTFQQYLTAPVKVLMPLPSWVFDDIKNPLKDGEQPIYPAEYTGALCSGAAALRSLKNLNPRPGSVIVISGIGGGVGHFTGQLARKVFNAKVIGVDWARKREHPCLSGFTTSDVFDIFVPAPEDESQWDSFQQAILAACSKLRGPKIKPRKADGLIVRASSAAALREYPSMSAPEGP